MKRHTASCAHAKELSKLRSQFFARRRKRDIQMKVRSTTQRRCRTVNPFCISTVFGCSSGDLEERGEMFAAVLKQTKALLLQTIMGQ